MKKPEKNKGKLTSSHEIAEQVGYNQCCDDWEKWLEEVEKGINSDGWAITHEYFKCENKKKNKGRL